MFARRRRMIVLIVAVPIIIVAVLFLGPVLLFVVGNTYAGALISSKPNHVWEAEFADIPEVALFLNQYPHYRTSHGGDVIGWKIIIYESEPRDGVQFHMYVKKSVLHGKVVIQAACAAVDSGKYAFDITREQAAIYLKGDGCTGVQT